ncbi:MAG: hypothetical protein Q8Q09_24680 [Deltaproteobacteria bacterium]|nr:hypothetical protein [Deltaproteobacteria bacterium]
MNDTSHFLRVVRTLAFVSGASLVACSPPVPTTDGGADGSSSDVTTSSDVVAEDRPTAFFDGPVLPDVSSDTVSPDASTQDAGADATASDASTADAVADAAADVSPSDGARADATPVCPMTTPVNESLCETVGQSCDYSDPGMGVFTFCSCDMVAGASPRWSCSMAVPGPLFPPEVSA